MTHSVPLYNTTMLRLNLLIAIMGDSYEKVKESERLEGVRERARIIVETERRFCSRKVLLPCQNKGTSDDDLRYMHFVEAVDSTSVQEEIVWEGVTKRVTEMVRTRTERLEQKFNGEIAQVQSKLDMIMDRLKER